MQAALGGRPSIWAMYRFATKLRANRPALNACLDACAASLRAEHPEMGRDVAIDASDLAAYANGHSHVHPGGPLRERYSDPDASWGYRSAVSNRGSGNFYGYKLDLAVCTRTGLPLAWQARSARHHESNYVAPLLDGVRARGFRPETCAMDKGYDSNRVHDECSERGVDAVVPLRAPIGGPTGRQLSIPIPTNGTRLNPHIERGTARYRDLYRRRTAVEREFGRLKTLYGLGPLRVRGLARVQLHADLTGLARLSLALSRSRDSVLAVAA